MKKIIALTLFPFLSFSAISQNTDTWNLERCINYAFAHNISIATSELQKETNENNLSQAQWSRLPNLSASASQSFDNEGASTLNAGLSSSVTLFAGGQTNKLIKQNKATVAQHSLQIEEAKNSVQLSILQSFIQCLYNKEAIDVAKSNAERTAQLHKQAQVKFEVGALSKKELAEIQAQYAQSQYSVLTAENNYANQVLALKQLLELPPQTAFEIEIPTIVTDNIVIPDLMETYNTALQTLPEMKSYAYQNRIDSLSVSIAKSAYFPTLSASAGINTNTYVFDKPDGESDVFRDRYNIGLSLSYPIFTRFQRKTQVDNAKINQKYTELAYESDKKAIYKSIETAHLNATTAQQNEIVLTQMLEAARTSYELSYEQFLLGGISSIDLSTTQTAFINAQLSLMQAKYYTVLYSQLLAFYGGEKIKL
ncbi:MAG: TolC family protein [Bacteroidales bacterium]|jgi:outer membrane protein|nr:TolC family protein [Bacteroidales bacterium]